MKKRCAWLLAGLMLFAGAADVRGAAGMAYAAPEQGKETREKSERADLPGKAETGAWVWAKSPLMTSEMKDLFTRAVRDLADLRYIPVAYVGSRAALGADHAVLCKMIPLAPESEITYVMAVLHEDAEGSASVAAVYASGAAAPSLAQDAVTGGWSDAASPVLSGRAMKALEKAMDGQDGVTYTPVALLAAQVAAGTNYALLCRVMTVTPDAVAKYAVVHVYEGLEGEADITQSFPFPYF